MQNVKCKMRNERGGNAISFSYQREGLKSPIQVRKIKITKPQKVIPSFWCREWDLMGSAHHSLREIPIVFAFGEGVQVPYF